MASTELPTGLQMQELIARELEACEPQVREVFVSLLIELRIKVPSGASALSAALNEGF